MISCPLCSKPNRDGSRFCNHCGQRLDSISRCPACGQANPSDAKFCNECGARLDMPQADAPAEPAEPVAPAETPPLAAIPERSSPVAPPPVEPIVEAHHEPPPIVAAPAVEPIVETRPEPPPIVAAPAADEPEDLEAALARRLGIALPLADQPPSAPLVRLNGATPPGPAEDAPLEPPAVGPREATGRRLLPLAVAEPEPPEVVEAEATVQPETVETVAAADEKGLVLARSLVERRPRIVALPREEVSTEAGRLFASVLSEPTTPYLPPRQAPRYASRLLGGFLSLLVFGAVALAFGDEVQRAPALAASVLSRVEAVADDLVQMPAALLGSDDGSANRGGQQ